MKHSIVGAALLLALPAFATDYTYLVNLDPNANQQFQSTNLPFGAGPVPYGPDTLTFTIPSNTCYPGNGYGMYCWGYENQISIAAQGRYELYSCGRTGCSISKVTMPQADNLQLFGFDANGNQVPALDVNGNVVTFAWSPLNAGAYNQVDRWIASGQLPVGKYLVADVSGTSCNASSRAPTSCATGGGSQSSWGVIFSAPTTYCSPYTSPPCQQSGSGDEGRTQ